MTGAQLPLYVILHVSVMTSYCCTAPDDDKFHEHCGLFAKNKKKQLTDASSSSSRVVAAAADSCSEGHWFESRWGRSLRNNCGQVVHTHRAQQGRGPA